jgi:hypothetical protein
VIEVPSTPLYGPGSLARRIQERLVHGPGPALANAALLAACARHRPDLVFAWRAPWLRPLTLRLARRLGAGKIAIYCNDDPFGRDRRWLKWRAWRRGIPEADLCLAYRTVNLDDLRAAGARQVALWRSAFLPRLHRPVPLTDEERRRLGCDVVFIGHYEDDGRLALVERLLASGLRVRIFGTGWEPVARGALWEPLLPIRPLRDLDYAKGICAARAALVLVSGRNRDGYTRRCFEIPACGTLMLAPRTPDLLELFRDGEEALFWGDAEELVAQARRAASDEPLRARIAEAGRARVWRDGHDLDARAQELLRLCGVA